MKIALVIAAILLLIATLHYCSSIGGYSGSGVGGSAY